MKNLLALLLVAGVMLGCGQLTKVSDPAKPHASGTPLEDDPGSGGGGPPPTTVDIAGGSITSPSGTLAIPVTLSYMQPTGTKAWQVTYKLSAGLTLSSVTWGSYSPDSSPIWWEGANSDGTRTLILAMRPGYCQQNGTMGYPNGGVLATITVGTSWTSGSHTEYVTLEPTPQGGVTPSPTVKDCSNVDVSTSYGVTSATVNVSL